jgi:hypothetical protein
MRNTFLIKLDNQENSIGEEIESTAGYRGDRSGTDSLDGSVRALRQPAKMLKTIAQVFVAEESAR